MLFFHVDKPHPSKLFQSYFGDLCEAVGAVVNFDRTIDMIYTHNLITQAVYNDVNTTFGQSTYQKGRRVVNELHRQIRSSQDPEQMLHNICDVLQSIDDSKLKEIALNLLKGKKYINTS